MANHQTREPAWKRWLSLHAYGAFASTLFRPRTPPEALRARFERFARVSRKAMKKKHPRLVFEDHPLGSLHLESVRATDSPSSIVIHLHGGAFVFGSPASYRHRAMRLSFRFDAEVFVPDYRLAPEHPFPAAFEDALAAYQHVRALRPGAPIFITGDSAGGGLALSLLVRLRELGARMPAGAILLSPWTDLSASGESVAQNREKDLWLTHAHLLRWGSYYAGSTDPRSPLLSPLLRGSVGPASASSTRRRGRDPEGRRRTRRCARGARRHRRPSSDRQRYATRLASYPAVACGKPRGLEDDVCIRGGALRRGAFDTPICRRIAAGAAPRLALTEPCREPGARGLPVPLHGDDGHPQHLGDVLLAQAAEEP